MAEIVEDKLSKIFLFIFGFSLIVEFACECDLHEFDGVNPK